MKIIRKYKLFFIVIVVTIVSYYIIQNYNKEQNRISHISISENELDIVFGQDSASLSIFMFSSYNCSFCRKFFLNSYAELKRDFIDNGKIKLIVKPVELSKSQSVMNSIKLAVCINEYGNFEKLHQLLLTEPTVVYTEEFKKVIEELSQKDLFVAECMLSGQSDEYLLNNINDFKKLNLKGTPTFIINNRIYKGYRNYDDFKKIVEKELKNVL
ncbi:MAG TPA: thioredoxin domain-containing protein [Bacteroidales bacterium]|nr:thioredoxin domain-containing protein [Bacteroidales bacterium]